MPTDYAKLIERLNRTFVIGVDAEQLRLTNPPGTAYRNPDGIEAAEAISTLLKERNARDKALNDAISELIDAEDAMKMSGRQTEAYELGIQISALETYRAERP
jgi:hypothetical protein